MPVERDNSKLVAPGLRLVAGLCWVVVALRNSGRLGLLLPSVAGLLFLVSAALGFRDWLHPRPEVKRTALWTRL